jgi:serine/threonine-protein kinase
VSHPERIGRYPVEGVLGEGAMGVVYKSHDPVIRRPLAIKTIHGRLDDGSEAVDSFAARFRNEAAAAGRLQHPGIVAVYEYGEAPDGAFIVMEYVEGTSLSRRLNAKEPFAPDHVVDLMCQVLEALHHAHEQGVWHRDIKPGNLIVTPAGRVKIADFGIARIESAGLTQATMTIGTPGYMAPEQYKGTGIDRRVDVFAAGALLYQLLAGRAPFTGATEAVMYQVMHLEPEPPSQASGGRLPSDYDAVVMQALAKNPDERFATAAAFRRALVDAHASAQDATRLVGARVLPQPAPRPAASPAPAVAPTTAAPAVTPASMAPTLALGGTPSSVWDPAVLRAVEVALATQVGPLARMLVQRAARQRRDIAGLQAFLLPEIGTVEGRDAFGQAMERLAAGAGTAVPGSSVPASSAPTLAAGGSSASGAGPGTRFHAGMPAPAPTPTPTPTPASTGALPPDVIERAQRILTLRIGPIARILVRKAAAEAGDRERFHALLLEHVEPASERAALLDELRRTG